MRDQVGDLEIRVPELLYTIQEDEESGVIEDGTGFSCT